MSYDAIVAPCFTTAPCPQRGRKVRVCQEIFNDWCESVQKAKSYGIVLFDDLPKELLDKSKIRFGPGTQFWRVRDPGAYSVNDWRFFAFREITRTIQEAHGTSSVFCTDLFDMVVQHNPHEWMKERGGLAFGVEDRIDAGPWMSDKLNSAYGEVWKSRLPGDLPRLTAGLFGGMTDALLPFLDVVCGIIGAIHNDAPDFNANMPAFQVAAHCGMMGRKVHFGSPLHHPSWRWGPRDHDAFFHHVWTGMDSPLFEKTA